jgi:hypothetical protein
MDLLKESYGWRSVTLRSTTGISEQSTVTRYQERNILDGNSTTHKSIKRTKIHDYTRLSIAPEEQTL